MTNQQKMVAIAQVLLPQMDALMGRTIAAVVMAELLMVPAHFWDSLHPSVENIWHMVSSYVDYAYNSGDDAQPPDWFQDEWISSDW